MAAHAAPLDRPFAADVAAGLSKRQKELPSKYLYDAIGTALFETITLLPEYGLTRAEERILRNHAHEIVAGLRGPLTVAELGSGTGRKTRWILEALALRGSARYFPIDISAAALARCKRELSDVGAIGIVGLEASYIQGLREAAERREGGETLLVLFLGSTIGNFERRAAEHFLGEIRSCLEPGDALLIGIDLESSAARLLEAYDDPAGVTAAFNLNLLARINRELGADFNVRRFAHVARWDRDFRRMEMHLRSRRSQTVHVRAAGVTVEFQEGETIWTEACHKYRRAELPEMAGRAGFRADLSWTDPEWPFSENLWIAV